MLTDQEFTELLEDMNSGEVSLLAAALKDLWRYPSADERVLPYLEERLQDKTPCVLGSGQHVWRNKMVCGLCVGG